MINDDDYNCSDDGGETYELSGSTFPRADESSLAHVGEEQLVVNLRRDVKVIMIEESDENFNCRSARYAGPKVFTTMMMMRICLPGVRDLPSKGGRLQLPWSGIFK